MVESNPVDPNQEVLQAFCDSVVQNNQEEAVFEGLTLLGKLVENKVKSPEEAKFNKFKRTNAKVASKILALQGGIHDFILAMGFTVTADDQYEFTGDLKVLKKGHRVLVTALEPMKVARMSPEDREKHELIESSKRQFAVEAASKKARREEQLRLQQADRKEKGTEPKGIASKANNLGFGADLHTFKPPASGG